MANKTGKTYYERNKKEADKKSNRKDYQQPRKVDFVEIENRPGYRPMGGGVAPGGGGAARPDPRESPDRRCHGRSCPNNRVW